MKKAVFNDCGYQLLSDDSSINIHDMEYMALYNRSQALEALTQLSLVPLGRKHYRPKELNEMIKNIKKRSYIQHFNSIIKDGIIAILYANYKIPLHAKRQLPVGHCEQPADSL